MGLAGQPDENVWAIAKKEKRIIITADRDFLDERRFPLMQSPGVIVLPAASKSIDQTLVALAYAISITHSHYELWRDTKIEMMGGGKLKVYYRNFESTQNKAATFRCKDNGEIFVWEN